MSRSTLPSQVVLQPGAEALLPDLLAEAGAERVLVVCTARHRAGADRVAQALGPRCVGVWAGAEPQVPEACADALVAQVEQAEADWLLAHGGGTAIGAAKAAALRTAPRGTALRIAAVPTTWSGSEMTGIWGLSRDGHKTTGRDPRVRPALVVLDPALFAAVRPEVRRSSLLNALAHSVDGLFDAASPAALHDVAEESIRDIVAALQRLEQSPGDIDALGLACRGACLAGAVLDGAAMALHHKLAHVLGGSFGTPHADTHAALLPYTLAYNQGADPRALDRLRRALGTGDPAAAVHDLCARLGVSTRLARLGLTRGDVPRIVDLALAQRYPNPRPLTADGLRDLLLDALHDRRPSLRTGRLALPAVTGPHAGLPAALAGPPLAQARAVVLAVHGRGSSSDAFVERLRPLVGSGVAIVAPQADEGTWYPHSFRRVQDNGAHLDSALAALDAAFDQALGSVPPERVVLVGFSQGACLALTWLARRAGRARPLAVAAWTGALPPGEPVAGDLSGLQAWLGTAAEDPWVTLDEVQATAASLRAAGAQVEVGVAPGGEHTIRETDKAALRRILEASVKGDDLAYLAGYGNHLHSEALPGVVPERQNGPRHVAHGLYAEQLNGAGFTLKRHLNHRVWMYRLRPQLVLEPWQPVDAGRFVGRFDEGRASPELLRFAPQPWPQEPVHFVQALSTFAGAGDPCTRTGFAIHLYAATADMVDTAFTDVDGDLLVVPQEGALRIRTELGLLQVSPGEIAILPRGIAFSVALPDGRARGFVGELFNGPYQLPQRGPVGANGLADERHFKAPVAAFEDRAVPTTLLRKQGGELWRSQSAHSPFDVVGWHGSHVPFKYDLADFNAYWGANWDHPDPSILTVLTAPHDEQGRNAVDFAVFKGRWDTVEHSFRPPFFHRNGAVEFNAVIRNPVETGPYRAGAVTYTPSLAAHGVGRESYEREVARTGPEADQPVRLPDEELWIQFESTYSLRVMPWVFDAPHRDGAYREQYRGFPPARVD